MCRIWGEHGQSALERARVCVLNCGPTGSEALKNLVLGGIGSFTIVDASKVSASDLGNNYLGELRFDVLVRSMSFSFSLSLLEPLPLVNLILEVYDGSFAVDWESMGQSKAKSVCALLQELNESVGAKFVEESPEALLESNPAFFAQFTLVIATQVDPSSEMYSAT